MTAAAIATGDRLGRYRLVRPLGAGAMGAVWAADDPELGRQVAIKVLHAHGHGADRAERLRREARAMAQLDHPNVVAVHDVGEDGGHVYVAMEVLGGGSLRDWIAAPRPWRAVVAGFVAAGRGLAAAHAAGLIHRDFKPDNVLVGDDGRIAVSDFGIARMGGDDPRGSGAVARGAVEAVTVPGLSAAPRDRAAVLATLTAAGDLIGTPAYISPEQYLGHPASAASDQFAFCVAQWEALYGQRPFRADPTDGLEPSVSVGIAIVESRISPPPASIAAPAWLRRALRRGLADDPARRHPSMAALIATLERGLGRRRRARIAAGAALAATATVAALVLWSRATAAGPSCDTTHELAGVWDPARRAQVRTAMVASGRPHAAATADRVATQLDAYAARWTTMRGEACRATRIEARQTAELLDLRNACLDRRRGELDALVAALADHPDGESVDRAIVAASELPALAPCADATALRAAVPLPADPETRTRVDAVRAQLARATAARNLGHFADARSRAAAAATSAAAIGFAPASAEAVALRGALEGTLHELAAARASLEEATRLAADAHDDRLAATASLDLYELVGVELLLGDEARALAPLVTTLVRRVGDPPDLRAELLVVRGSVHVHVSGFDEARADFEEAARIADGAGLAELGNRARQGLATLTLTRGQVPEALVLQQRIGAYVEATYGADHPAVATSLRETARILIRLGRYDDAAPLLARALEIRRRTFGENHGLVIDLLMSLGEVAEGRGDLAATRALFRDAVDRAKRAGPAEDATRANALNGLATVEAKLGDWDHAHALFEEGLALRARAGTEDLNYAIAEYNLADAEANHGDCPRARPRFAHAGRIFEGTNRAYPMIALAQCALGEERYAEAIASAREVIAICQAGGCNPMLPGVARATIGKAQWWSGDKAAGRVTLTQARAELGAIPRAADQLPELDAWMKKWGVR